MNGYTIRFSFPDCPPMFAGDYKGALGWALVWDSPEAPRRFLEDGYGASKRWGEVVEIRNGEVVGVVDLVAS